MMDQRADLGKRLKASLEQCREIVFVCLHGSFLDEALPYHDIDIAIYLDPAWASGQDIFEYEMSLSVNLTLALHVPIDIHVLNKAPVGFQYSVFHRGKVLFVRDADGDERLTDLVERVGLAYMEFSYHSKKYLQEVTS
ncbi:MAG: nucleotidyltransferase domain-containing protein [Deltaproteobacteria bacterium]|nr:nucleotidyltransferase domain-containing protein [Deltaproteobacteria bacterium]